jgi:hypothetical protein
VGNYVFEQKMHCCVSDVIVGGNGFDPFGKVIHYYDDILVSIAIWRVSSHEVDAPFVEEANSDD